MFPGRIAPHCVNYAHTLREMQAKSKSFLLHFTQTMRIVCLMAILRMTTRRKPTNLTLSKETLSRGRKLAKLMNRPSLSNVIEHLIMEAYKAGTPFKP
jgi:hypothetical protein